MFYIPKIGDYLKILTDDEVKDFVVKSFGEYFKSTKEKLYFKFREEQNLRKVAESLHVFLTTTDKVEKSNSSDIVYSIIMLGFRNIFDSEL